MMASAALTGWGEDPGFDQDRTDRAANFDGSLAFANAHAAERTTATTTTTAAVVRARARARVAVEEEAEEAEEEEEEEAKEGDNSDDEEEEEEEEGEGEEEEEEADFVGALASGRLASLAPSLLEGISLVLAKLSVPSKARLSAWMTELKPHQLVAQILRPMQGYVRALVGGVSAQGWHAVREKGKLSPHLNSHTPSHTLSHTHT